MSAKNKMRAPRVLLDAAEAAEYLGVTERWVRRAIKERRIPFVKLGAMVRFEPEALDRYLDSARVEPETQPDRRGGDRRSAAYLASVADGGEGKPQARS